jgi:formate dehydrogenase maturation protein FdhE
MIKMRTINPKTSSVVRFRKNIDLKVDTKQALSLQAVQHGMSLKSYIEKMLEALAEMEEDRILAVLSNIPEAQTALSGVGITE